MVLIKYGLLNVVRNVQIIFIIKLINIKKTMKK